MIGRRNIIIYRQDELGLLILSYLLPQNTGIGAQIEASVAANYTEQ